METRTTYNSMMGMMMCICMEMCSVWRAQKAACLASCPVER